MPWTLSICSRLLCTMQCRDQTDDVENLPLGVICRALLETPYAAHTVKGPRMWTEGLRRSTTESRGLDGTYHVKPGKFSVISHEVPLAWPCSTFHSRPIVGYHTSASCLLPPPYLPILSTT